MRCWTCGIGLALLLGGCTENLGDDVDRNSAAIVAEEGRATQVEAALTERIAELEAALASVQPSLDALQSTVASLQSTAASNAAAITDLEGTTTDHASRLASVEAATADLTSTAANHTSRLASVETATTSLATVTADHTSRLATAETAISATGSSVTTLQSSVTAHSASLGALQTTVTAHSGELAGIATWQTQTDDYLQVKLATYTTRQQESHDSGSINPFVFPLSAVSDFNGVGVSDLVVFASGYTAPWTTSLGTIEDPLRVYPEVVLDAGHLVVKVWVHTADWASIPTTGAKGTSIAITVMRRNE